MKTNQQAADTKVLDSTLGGGAAYRVPLYLSQQYINEENQAVMTTRHALTSADDYNSYCVLRRAMALV